VTSPQKTVILTGRDPLLTYRNKSLERGFCREIFPYLRECGFDERRTLCRIKNTPTDLV
jgi:hypothetical protein